MKPTVRKAVQWQLKFAENIAVKAGTAYPMEAMYWIGYTYRYWHYYTGEYSREIYQIADADTMCGCWLGFHTLDVEMAVDDLKEIHAQRCNESHARSGI